MSKQQLSFLADVPVQSRYTVESLPNGFVVTGKDRMPVKVVFHPTFITVLGGEITLATNAPTTNYPITWAGQDDKTYLYEYIKIEMARPNANPREVARGAGLLTPDGLPVNSLDGNILDLPLLFARAMNIPREMFTDCFPDSPTCTEKEPMGMGLCETYFPNAGKRLNFYDRFKLSELIADGLMDKWSPRNLSGEGGETISKWAKEQTAGCIGKRVQVEWTRLLEQIDPDILAVHRAMFAANFNSRDDGLEFNKDLYSHKHIVSDILKYRSAAIATRYVSGMKHGYFDNITYERIKEVKSYPPIQVAIEITRKMGLKIDFGLSDEAKEISHLDLMQNWRDLYSATGSTYTSLNKTLDRLPGGIGKEACYLQNVELERPIYERSELLMLLHSIYRRHEYESIGSNLNRHIFMYCTKDQVKEVLRRVGRYTHQNLDFRKSKDIQFVARFLADYPEEHTGNLVGLADKSLEWHRDKQEENIRNQTEKLGGDTKAATPPVPLPNYNGNVKFLSTVKDICIEAEIMGNCVASYAEKAIEGECFLFHIEKDDELATIEVSTQGKVVQAEGPRNQPNNAAKWGKRVLSKWGGNFRLDR